MVCLAKHSRLPRLDALKLLRADASADDQYRARFARKPIWCLHGGGLVDRESGEEMGPGSRRAVFVSCRRCPGSLRATVSAQLAGRREEPAEAPAVVATKWVVPRPVVLA